MVGENRELFELSSWQKDKEMPVSKLDQAISRVSDIEENLLRGLERRLYRGERLTAADYKILASLRDGLGSRRDEGRSENFVDAAKEVAAHFKRTVRTIRNWAGRGMPQEVDGYDLLKIEQWALRKGVIKDPVTPAEQSDALEAQETVLDRSHYEIEIKRLDSELKGLKLQRETGELISRAEVERGWYDRAFEFKRELLSMARRLSLKGAQKEAPELYELIRQDAMEVLRKYSRGHIDIENLSDQPPAKKKNNNL